jgi:hypothetical protein
MFPHDKRGRGKEAMFISRPKLVIVFLLGAILLLVSSPADSRSLYYAYGFKPGSEPQGFRGLRWGNDIAIFNPLEKFEPVKIVGSATFYHRKGEVLQWGLAELQDITYIFWGGRFANVLIKTFGRDNFDKLKTVVFAQYGQGSRTKSDEQLDIQNYFWKGFVTGMFLKYDDATKMGELGLYSLKNHEDRLLFWE